MDQQKLALLKISLMGMVRNFPAETIIEELALAFGDEDKRQMDRDNHLTISEAKVIARREVLAMRLHQSLLRD